MFSRRVFGGSPDSFKLLLEYGSPSLDYAQQEQSRKSLVRLPVAIASLEFEFNSDESEAAIVERFSQKKNALLLDRIEERVIVKMATDGPAQATIWANSAHAATEPKLSLQLSVARWYPVLRTIQVYRLSSAGSASDAVMEKLLGQCDLTTVWKLKGVEGFGSFWCTAASIKNWCQLRNMNLSHCGLAVLPAAIGDIPTLRILRLSYNKLTGLPSELQALSLLEVLAADHNLLTSIPAELRHCSALRELNLEGNKLTRPVLDLRSLSSLQSLQLYGNPLEYLPELSPCVQLRSLSLANARIMADATFTRWEVDVGALSYMARGHKLSPLFSLTFRRSSLQHPLLAGALGRIAEDRTNCELIAKEEAAIQQLVLMALSENLVVVRQACKTIGLLAAYSPITAKQLIAHDVLSAIVALMKAPNQDSQLCGLNVLSSLAAGSDSVSAQLMSPSMLQRLHALIRDGDPSVRQAALYSLSNLSFCRDNKVMVRKADGLLQMLVELAQPHPSQGTSDMSRLMAVRALAVLGENEQVRLALHSPVIQGRGLRILSMDGGGMRGLVMVHMLRHLERRLGRPLASFFDLVVGTSTGAGHQAVSLGMLKYNLDQCEGVYTQLGHKVFNNQASTATRESEMATWSESLYRMYKSGSQQMRAAVYGCKHDASTFESLLKDMCNLAKLNCVSDQLIDAAVLGGPKVAVVSTLGSTTPALPYVFRSFELPVEAERRAAKMGACEGSSRHLVWQAVRASSAAPYYLDDFLCGEDRFQDGATIANNPTLIAIQQARLLWPDIPLECVVSLGSGLSPTKPRERSMHSYMDTGNVLIESATSTERVHEAAATLLQMVPGVKYFRFQPVDERCTIQLDDVNPDNWAKLKVATEEYCIAHAARFDEAAAALLAPERGSAADGGVADGDDIIEGQALSLTSPRVPTLRLGFRRGLLLLEAPRSRQPLLGMSVTERLADLVGALPALTRRADVSATATTAAGPHELLGCGAAVSASPAAGAGKHGAAGLLLPQQQELKPSVYSLDAPFGSVTTEDTAAWAVARRTSPSPRQSLPGSSAWPSSNPLSPTAADALARVPDWAPAVVAADCNREASALRHSADPEAPRRVSDTATGSSSTTRPLIPPLPSMALPRSVSMAPHLSRASRVGTLDLSTSPPPVESASRQEGRSTGGGAAAPASPPSSSFLNYFIPTSWTSTSVAAAAAAVPGGSNDGARTSDGGSMEPIQGDSPIRPVQAAIRPKRSQDVNLSQTMTPMKAPGPGQPSMDSTDAREQTGGGRQQHEGHGGRHPAQAQQQQQQQEQQVEDGLAPHCLIRGLLQDLSEIIGVVHLALHATSRGGLVTQWQQEVMAVVEPGPDAARLVQELGGDPALTSLSQLCSSCSPASCFQAGDSQLIKLAHQEVITAMGTQVSSYLFQRTSPLRALLPDHILAMLSDWSGLLVTSATPLARPLLEALLRSGAKAVVAPAEDSWLAAVVKGGVSCEAAQGQQQAGPGTAARQEQQPRLLVRTMSSHKIPEVPDGTGVHLEPAGGGGGVGGGDPEAAVLAFFAAFYEALFGGEAVLSAIQAGERVAPEMAGVFVCYHL